MLRVIESLTPMNPAFALALDEALLTCAQTSKQDVLHLWVNDRAVIIGRSQSAASEVDLRYAATHNIPVLRRISGGGAVYHYPGNLNLSLILHDARSLGGVAVTYRAVGEALVHALHQVGIDSHVDTNAIMIGEKKIAGAAQVRRRSALLYHTTLLVHPPDLPIPQILRAMDPSYDTKAVPSHPQPLASLSEVVPAITMNSLSLPLIRAVSDLLTAPTRADRYDKEEVAHATRLKCNKYESDRWNLFH